MGFLSSIISGGVTGIVDSVSSAVDKFVTTPDEKAKLKLAIREIEVREKKTLIENTHRVIEAEAKSDDPFVRRARPMFLWVVYVILVFNFIIVPILNMGGQYWGATPFTPLPLPEELYWLFGSCMLGYTGARTWDKKIMNAKSAGRAL